jgi:hypothetical protein
MTSERKRESFEDQGEHNTETAAGRIARSIQTPRQTKEQTRLIAQGIAKGIALYKKQHNEQARERDKARKKALKQRAGKLREPAGLEPAEGSLAETRSPVAALFSAAALFGAAAVTHLMRYFSEIPVTIGQFTVPLWWSLPIAALAGAFAGWLSSLGWAECHGGDASDPSDADPPL